MNFQGNALSQNVAKIHIANQGQNNLRTQNVL